MTPSGRLNDSDPSQPHRTVDQVQDCCFCKTRNPQYAHYFTHNRGIQCAKWNMHKMGRHVVFGQHRPLQCVNQHLNTRLECTGFLALLADPKPRVASSKSVRLNFAIRNWAWQFGVSVSPASCFYAISQLVRIDARDSQTNRSVVVALVPIAVICPIFRFMAAACLPYKCKFASPRQVRV